MSNNKKSKTKKWITGIIATSVLAAGITVPFGEVSHAKAPIGTVEQFVDPNKLLDLSTYKTQVGKTVQNKYGKLTLNEVLVDVNGLIISSTYEPAKGIKFDEKSQLTPRVLINGKDLQKTRGSQTIKVNNNKYTIYGDIKFSELPDKGPLQIKITYDTFYNLNKKKVTIKNPWVFNVKASTNHIQKDTKVVQLNKTVTLHNGKKVNLNKMIVSPVSTLLYYDLTKGTEKTFFKLLSASGEEVRSRASYAFNIKEKSYNRFGPIDLGKEKYMLVPVNEDDEEIGFPVSIN
ncbi:DUF4179 domain-containing protein [Paenibacillus sp. FSL W8-0187]|uniref:DUF4179 domain-containing protein n=1 Tax=Paenibacillus TaxID=44249 RepID=UPI0030DC4896